MDSSLVSNSSGKYKVLKLKFDPSLQTYNPRCYRARVIGVHVYARAFKLFLYRHYYSRLVI